MARKKEFDEDALLDKAAELFWRKGYNGTSAQDLVDGLGINRSSIYNTYTDKRTLFKKALCQYQATQTGAMLAMLAKAEDAESTVNEVFKGLIKGSIEDSLLKGCFMVNTAVELAGQDKEIGDIVNKNNQSVEDALTRLIEKGQQSGQFSTKNSACALARFIFASITSIKVAARTGADEKTLRDIADVALSALIA
ncbi:TetR/AcrR family transcriptional regulator [Mucilaginibacter sabulilitoris]|uniref:TetR/AcrR family transcriptional regulator n=1 Tax=Mucilaginibacter sabulilitoris TaxID=1173583 RepID=A0ABZ0TJV1_9SPHI|nr:TetR/AcrR family transcriptional regulator [Mucilaginibacter sabulilitoris]WPU93222.1 TetR/AcrR family transcriptional regulator [Mucilaginibacter sabulilitoris]